MNRRQAKKRALKRATKFIDKDKNPIVYEVVRIITSKKWKEKHSRSRNERRTNSENIKLRDRTG